MASPCCHGSVDLEKKQTVFFFLKTLIYTLQVGAFQNRMFLMEIRGNFAAVLW